MSIHLDELKDVEVADVYKAGVYAATLRRTAHAIVFAYERSYLDANGPPVATTLPLDDEPLSTHASGALPPFFAGLLPEGRRLIALQRAVKTSADDELTLLLAVGADTVGDVQVVAAGSPPEAPRPHLEISSWSSVRFSDLAAAGFGTDVDRVGLPGVQEKVSARMISFPIERQSERYLLKLSPPEYPHLVENEAFFLSAARQTGLETAHAEIVHDNDGRPGLLVRRFDRVATPGGVRMLAQEDGCQVLGRYPADKYRVTTEELVAALAGVCRARPAAARELLRQIAFAYLSCNGDAHAKNFSVIHDDGEWRVTPLYDAPSSHPYGDTTMALPIAGKRREDIGRTQFLALGAAVGLRERAVHKLLDDLLARAEVWLDALDQLPFDPHRRRKLRRAVEYRRARLAVRGAG